jgi:hypothetical protein
MLPIFGEHCCNLGFVHHYVMNLFISSSGGLNKYKPNFSPRNMRFEVFLASNKSNPDTELPIRREILRKEI